MNFLKEYQEEINNSLDEFWEGYKNPDCDKPEAELVEAMKYSVLNGGKRLRPILALCAYELGEESSRRNKISRENVIKITHSLEFLHASSLVHDDLPALDNDLLRRGQPTTWKKYGEALGVLTGDALQNLSIENLANYAPEDLLPKLLKHFTKSIGINGMLGGQVRDIYFEHKEVTLDELENTHLKKTGALIVTSLFFGGVLAELNNEKLKLLNDYAIKLGLCYQVKDDLLDIEGDEKIVGKKLGKDAISKGYISCLGIEETKNYLERLKNEALVISKELQSEKLDFLVKYICERDL